MPKKIKGQHLLHIRGFLRPNRTNIIYLVLKGTISCTYKMICEDFFKKIFLDILFNFFSKNIFFRIFFQKISQNFFHASPRKSPGASPKNLRAPPGASGRLRAEPPPIVPKKSPGAARRLRAPPGASGRYGCLLVEQTGYKKKDSAG